MTTRKTKTATPPDEAFANGAEKATGENGGAPKYQWGTNDEENGGAGDETKSLNAETGGIAVAPGDKKEYEHDQLPSPEEAKVNLVTANKGLLKTAVMVLTFIGVVVLVVLALVSGKGSSSEVETFTDRSEEVILFLRDYEVATEPALRDQGSPAHRAAQFLADGDLFEIELNEENAEIFSERFVLATVYYAMQGESWTHQLEFLSAEDHCRWFSNLTTNKGKTVHQGVKCNENGNVVELNLAYNNVHGGLPNELPYLKHLESLQLQNNPGVHGDLPQFLTKMPALKNIGLQYCKFNGGIPTWFGEMTQLTHLGLGDNQFTGQVPPQLASLKNLKFLSLDNLGLVGNLDFLKSMRQMETLYLNDNALSGQIEGFIANWQHLKEIDVSGNMLDGKVPATFINLPKLAVADLHHNMFYGQFPEDIYQNDHLQYLALQWNQLQGPLTDRIGFLENLHHLDVSYNALNGTVPNTIDGLTKLRFLSTSGNRFAGQKFLDLSKLTSLVDLSMKDNKMAGTFPNWIGGLTKLRLLDLDRNELSGSIPSWIGLLKDLEHLLLNRNQITGTLPTELLNLHRLNTVLLDKNSISGSAQNICDSDKVNPLHLTADCYPGADGKPEIDCRCCTECCTDGNDSCNDKKWVLTNSDYIWEYGFVRPEYRFDLTNLPVYPSNKEGEGSTVEEGELYSN